MSPLDRLVRPFTRSALRPALQMGVVSVVAYVLGSELTRPFHDASATTGGLWAAISAVLVLQQTRRETQTSVRMRLLGTLVGSVVSFAYLSVFRFGVVGLAVCIVVTVLCCYAAGIPDHAKTAELTVLVILVLSSVTPAFTPLESALMRFCQALLGTATAFGVATLWPHASDRSANG